MWQNNVSQNEKKNQEKAHTAADAQFCQLQKLIVSLLFRGYAWGINHKNEATVKLDGEIKSEINFEVITLSSGTQWDLLITRSDSTSFIHRNEWRGWTVRVRIQLQM